MIRFYEEGRLEKRWIEEYCLVANPECTRKQLDKAGIYHPDNMLPDGSVRKELG